MPSDFPSLIFDSLHGSVTFNESGLSAVVAHASIPHFDIDEVLKFERLSFTLAFSAMANASAVVGRAGALLRPGDGVAEARPSHGPNRTDPLPDIPEQTLWTITSGEQYCELTDVGKCVSVANYGPNERCTVRAVIGMTVTSEDFKTNSYGPSAVTIGGMQYAAGNWSNGLRMEAGDILASEGAGSADRRTDTMNTFKICGLATTWTVKSGHQQIAGDSTSALAIQAVPLQVSGAISVSFQQSTPMQADVNVTNAPFMNRCLCT